MPLTTDQLIAQSKQMLAQTAAEGTKAFAGSSYDTVKPTIPPITASALEPNKAIELPTKPTLTNPLPGGFIPPAAAPVETTTPDASNDWIKSLFDSVGTPPSVTDMYNTAYGQSGIADLQKERETKRLAQKQAQDEFNAIQSQLQGVALEAQAIPIQIQQSAQEGGANVTKGGLAPVQTAALRNNALKAIPLQAQGYMAQAKLAAAQGDTQLAQEALDSATAHLDKIYQMHQTDALNMYNYKKELRDKVYDYATKQEQRKIDSMNKADDRAFTIKQNSISNAQVLSRLAIENGLGSTATQIASLDPSSPTYQQDLAKLQGDIAIAVKKKQDAATALANQKIAKAPETVKVGETTMQWNADTGKWEPIEATGTTGGLDTQKSRDQFGLMFDTIDKIKSPEIYNASGRSKLRQTVENWIPLNPLGSQSDYNDLVALTNTLRTNMLTMQTDPAIKKFFGPQMSNADVQLMTAAGTTVNPELQSPEMLKSEVERIQDLTIRARQSLDGVTQWSKTSNGTRVGLYPDGIIRDINGNHYDANGKKIYDAKTGKNI